MGNAEVIPANQGISSITRSGLIEKGCVVFISHFSITLMSHKLILRTIFLIKLKICKNVTRNGMFLTWGN